MLEIGHAAVCVLRAVIRGEPAQSVRLAPLSAKAATDAGVLQRPSSEHSRPLAPRDRAA